MRRLVVLLALASAALVLAPSASAAIGPEQDAATRAPDAASCAPPCTVYYFKKGPGVARVVATPPGDPPLNCWSDCKSMFGEETITLRVYPAAGWELKGWQNCPTTLQDGSCVIPPDPVVYVCAWFDAPTAPTPPETICPPYEPGLVPSPPPPPASPPPPPSGAPPLGSRCTIPGTAGANVINGTAGRDVICGRGGNDTINGRGGHDLILGGTGADRLTGGLGRDAIYGGSGNDALIARDGIRDTVNGGLGRDRARWDARDVRRSIERRF